MAGTYTFRNILFWYLKETIYRFVDRFLLKNNKRANKGILYLHTRYKFASSINKLQYMKAKWTKEAVIEESRKYRTKADFRRGNPGASAAARRQGWINEITWFEKPKSWKLKWTQEAVFTESKKHNSLDSFRQSSRGAYTVAYKNGWLDEMTWLQRKQIKGSSGIWSDGHNLHYINSKHDDGQLRTVGNSLILSCSVLVES